MAVKTGNEATTGPTSIVGGNLFDKALRALQHRPQWFALLVVLALIALPVTVWLDLRNISNAALTRQASDLNSMISGIRGYYASNVVGRIQQNDGESVPAHNYEEIDGGIPIPATLSIELGSLVDTRGDNIRYRFVSDEVFESRSPHRLDTFETDALAALRTGVVPVNGAVTEISGSFLNRRIRMAVPVVMGQACVACHNSHPESPRKDWKVGDVRGIQAITIEQPIAANFLSFKYLLLYLLAAGLIGGAIALLQWRQAQQFRQMNDELEETNSFLASISLKISKYLSPQVYRSIFSGERDAIISTERKQLTIFFSDIKDFTVTTERLQPEALTELLNEYFTEMTEIAHAHGATVDKFIGDAILAFFGDPETRGAAEDARACLAMAAAMQKRIGELSRDWRRRGVEQPFQVRMGINTGYCNVGNFGSADRMDYTIIGAEANLAARLQSIAEPGGIVVSYETFALVEDMVDARALASIRLKGINRDIVPYAVEGVRGADRSDVIEENTDRLHLRLDFDGLKAQEGQEIETALRTVLEELKRRRSPAS